MSKRFKINSDQLSLPFTEARSMSIDAKERVFWTLCFMSLCSLVMYFYAINAIARNTAIRGNLEAHIADASGRVAALEFAYIGLENSVTAEVAQQYGFREVREPLYVSRNPQTTLTLNR